MSPAVRSVDSTRARARSLFVCCPQTWNQPTSPSNGQDGPQVINRLIARNHARFRATDPANQIVHRVSLCPGSEDMFSANLPQGGAPLARGKPRVGHRAWGSLTTTRRGLAARAFLRRTHLPCAEMNIWVCRFLGGPRKWRVFNLWLFLKMGYPQKKTDPYHLLSLVCFMGNRFHWKYVLIFLQGP